MNKIPASLRSDFSDCRFASEQVPLCFGIRADFIGILTRMRDRLIHGYFGVDYQLVWDVVQEKLPELKRNIQSIIDKLQQA